MSVAIGELALKVEYLRTSEIDRLRTAVDEFDVILVSPPIKRELKSEPYHEMGRGPDADVSCVLQWLAECRRHLSRRGSMLVFGLPRWLPYAAEFLGSTMVFKYWIAVKGSAPKSQGCIGARHEGVLLFVNRGSDFTINTVRHPHIFCAHCGDYLADWGGKKHLRPKDGPVVSDVWDDRADLTDEPHGLSPVAFDRLLRLTCSSGQRVLVAAYDGEPYEGSVPFRSEGKADALTPTPSPEPLLCRRPEPCLPQPGTSQAFEADRLYVGECASVMAGWLEDERARFDLIFADPPYNLEKQYGRLSDDLKAQEYVRWCDTWLELCSLLLKPHGALLVLNLPKWSYLHATRLNRLLWFQRWIAWDALSDPRGKIMPAHYGLLYYSKDPRQFTCNEMPSIPVMNLCFRQKCIASRPKTAPTESISDIWYDVHRIKHKRDRDDHPCQLPVRLLERVIAITTNPGDMVLDPFLGTGTSAVVAKSLGRRYAGIDIDPHYCEIAQARIDSISVRANTDRDSQAPTSQLKLPGFPFCSDEVASVGK